MSKESKLPKDLAGETIAGRSTGQTDNTRVALSTFGGTSLGTVLVSFPETRNVLQGTIFVGVTNEPFQLEAGSKTLTLASPGPNSLTRGSDFSPKQQKVKIKPGEAQHVQFTKG
jgi:hypothetical protein